MNPRKPPDGLVAGAPRLVSDVELPGRSGGPSFDQSVNQSLSQSISQSVTQTRACMYICVHHAQGLCVAFGCNMFWFFSVHDVICYNLVEIMLCMYIYVRACMYTWLCVHMAVWLCACVHACSTGVTTTISATRSKAVPFISTKYRSYNNPNAITHLVAPQ